MRETRGTHFLIEIGLQKGFIPHLIKEVVLWEMFKNVFCSLVLRSQQALWTLEHV